VRERREELVLQAVRLLGVLGHRLCKDRPDDQMFVRFAQLGHELFQLRPRLRRFVPRAHSLPPKRRDLLVQSGGLIPRAARRWPARRSVVVGHIQRRGRGLISFIGDGALAISFGLPVSKPS
jgi:hypothetical protein